MLTIRKEQTDKFGPQAAKTFEPTPTPTFRMLHIRKEQIDVFQQQAEINFVDYVAKQLRNNHAEAVKDVLEDKFYKRIEYGIRRAREYGLTWKNNLSTFVTLMFVIAPDFDRSPSFRRYLTAESVPPNDRMDVLLRETTENDWQNAQKASAPNNWPEDML
ncbi:MAG TPA: hypothetical protein VMX13_13275 [Sedimentisphaerales bacterium]|nr:hypothetical protein [Sedimentisphaerales bacterium]